MSDLKILDKRKLEKLLIGSPGYVLDFSDRTFRDFILDSVQVNIDEEKYKDIGTSKANRLRSFWNQESNSIVGKLLKDLIEYAAAIEFSYDDKLITECSSIAKKLLTNCPSLELIEPPSVEAHFEHIQQEIIGYINNAKFMIWVAVAWFTDKEIFDALVTKKNEGVNVQLIIIDDEINRNSKILYEDEFETYRVPKAGKYENIMHEKFCVIDLWTVIHGTYNWTVKAKFNSESISTIKGRQYAEKFAERFISLKRSI